MPEELPDEQYAAWEWSVGRGFHREAGAWGVFLLFRLPEGVAFPEGDTAAFAMPAELAEKIADRLRLEAETVRSAHPN